MSSCDRVCNDFQRAPHSDHGRAVLERDADLKPRALGASCLLKQSVDDRLDNLVLLHLCEDTGQHSQISVIVRIVIGVCKNGPAKPVISPNNFCAVQEIQLMRSSVVGVLVARSKRFAEYCHPLEKALPIAASA